MAQEMLAHHIDGELEWKVHTPNLLEESLKNKGAEALHAPFRIFGNLLHQVAHRAVELDDPALNILMMRLTLYEQADPDKFSLAEINAAYEAQRKRLT